MPDRPVRRPVSEPREDYRERRDDPREPPDDYRVNAAPPPVPAPRGRKIVEEPLPY